MHSCCTAWMAEAKGQDGSTQLQQGPGMRTVASGAHHAQGVGRSSAMLVSCRFLVVAHYIAVLTAE